MRPRPHLLVLCASLTVSAGVLVSTPLAAHAASPTGDQPTVAVSGTLLQIPAEPDSGRDEPAYALRLSDDSILPVDPDLASTPAPNATLRGDLVVPEAVQDSLAARGVELGDGDSVRASSATGKQALSLVEGSAATPAVTDAEVTAPALAAPATSTHRLLVAVPDNLGTTSSTDATILEEMRTVAAYWDDESDGAVDVVPPTAVKHYSSAVTGAQGDCGLGASSGTTFPKIAAEAAKQFPDYSSRTDQVVVLAPENGCSGAGSALGIGVVGNGFSSAGYLVATASKAYAVGTVAHEMGHNYGFLHANVRCGTSCSKEYAGIYDVMGYGIAGVNGLPSLGTAYRTNDAITTVGEVESLSTASGSGLTRTIAPREAETGRRSLAVTDPGDGTVYYVDYRSGTGQDAGTAYARGRSVSGYSFSTGVVVGSLYRSSSRSTAGGELVVPTGTRTAARAGETWTSPSGRVVVSVDAVSSAAATVTVSFAGAESPTTSPGPVTAPVPVTSPVPATSAPRASGVVRVGSRLTAVPGAWTSGTTVDYAWRAGGSLVSTTASWTPTAASRGRALTLTVTGHLTGYVATSRTTSLGIVGYGALASVTPRLSGVSRVGQVLRLSRGTWTPGATLSQVWYAGGRAVSRSTAVRLTPAMRGKRVTVRVTGRKVGYASLTRSSAATTSVRRR